MENRISMHRTGKITGGKVLYVTPSNMEAASARRGGTREHPASPPSARRLKRGVPPLGMVLDAVLKVPGQRIPTDRPQMPQPRRLIAGSGDQGYNKVSDDT